MFRLGYTVPHSIPSRPSQRPIDVVGLSKDSVQIGRINLEASLATAPRRWWSLHTIRVKAKVMGFGSGEIVVSRILKLDS